MSMFRLIIASLRHHVRIHVAVALGVMAATAVLTGALLVGDSVRGSLRHLTLDRLGRIDEVLVTDRFFRTELAAELASDSGFQRQFEEAQAVILVRGTVESHNRSPTFTSTPGPIQKDIPWNYQLAATDPNGDPLRFELVHGPALMTRHGSVLNWKPVEVGDFQVEVAVHDDRGGMARQRFTLPVRDIPLPPQFTKLSEMPAAESTARANQVTLLGTGAEFWDLGGGGPEKLPKGNEIVLNEPLATELKARVGVEVIVRIPVVSNIASESPLGEKVDTVESIRLTVADVIPAKGLGRFGLRPNQQLPLNAYVPLPVLQRVVGEQGRANAIFVAGTSMAMPSTEEGSQVLADALQPRPEDYGLAIERVRIGEAEQPIAEYFNITSARMLLDGPVVDAAKNAFGDRVQTALTYLANTIRANEKRIPYSTVTGIEPHELLGPFPPGEKPLADDEIVLNRWAADDLGVKPGDQITLTYYPPESTHGELVEAPPAVFRLRGVVSLAPKDQTPTLANDPGLTPDLEGVTDQASIDDWDLPFELVEQIRQQDEDYWDDHRTTPKAFVSLATARRLWASRFGDTTSLRIPAAEGLTPEKLFAALDLNPADLGFVFQPIKRQSLTASSGTTPFDLLFLGFSFFLIAAAVMLILLLFRLGVEQRAEEIGIEMAVGLPGKKIRRLFAAEGFVVSAVGGLLGIAAGVAYAWTMLAGLRTWWLAAVSTPFLHLYVTPRSLVLGYGIGIAVSMVTIVYALWRMGDVSVRQLLAGQAGKAAGLGARPSTWQRRAAQGMLVLAVLVGLMAMQLGGEAQAGAFFGSGSLVLVSVLLLIYGLLRSGGTTKALESGFALRGLALRNGARNPSRSTLTIGLVASASFLIAAISAFRLETSEEGAGGFELMAESDDPIIYNLNSKVGRFELAFASDESDLLERSANMFSLRVRAGDDASCLNLYKPQQPRVLGVPRRLVERGGFAWADSAANTDEERKNPWRLLDRPISDGAIPVVIDMNTAMYSLHLWQGVGETYSIDDGRGGEITFRVVGLLKNSVLQGSLLISEEHFLDTFSQITGHRFFFIDVKEEQSAEREKLIDQIAETLEGTLGDKGFDVVRTRQRLAGLLAVQNTYLSTFQSLGALGLLLGTVGLATVQLRNVIERRGELALMRAAGFRRRRLGRLVLLENALLLLAGLGTGIAAALVAILPHLLSGGAAIPFVSLAIMLVVVFLVGMIAGIAAVRATLNAPLLEALRGD